MPKVSADRRRRERAISGSAVSPWGSPQVVRYAKPNIATAPRRAKRVAAKNVKRRQCDPHDRGRRILISGLGRVPAAARSLGRPAVRCTVVALDASAARLPAAPVMKSTGGAAVGFDMVARDEALAGDILIGDHAGRRCPQAAILARAGVRESFRFRRHGCSRPVRPKPHRSQAKSSAPRFSLVRTDGGHTAPT